MRKMLDLTDTLRPLAVFLVKFQGLKEVVLRVRNGHGVRAPNLLFAKVRILAARGKKAFYICLRICLTFINRRTLFQRETTEAKMEVLCLEEGLVNQEEHLCFLPLMGQHELGEEKVLD